MACAIQLKRFGLQPLVIEKDHPGGLLVNASLVENYPGFEHAIQGATLMEQMKKQAQK
jgi:thioredoxin reductase (NADPH)